MTKTITREKAMQFRTHTSALAIQEEIQGYSLEEFISNSYLFKTKNDIFNKLLLDYEKMLSICIINFNKFDNELHNFLKDKANYIQENYLYNDFFDFTYFVYLSFLKKDNNSNNKCLIAYQNLLLQQYAYLCNENKLIAGIKTNGTLIEINELYPKLDYTTIEQVLNNKKEVPLPKLKKCFKKYGYDINDFEELNVKVFTEQMFTNVIYQNCFLINEHLEDMLPFPILEYSKYIPQLPRIWKSTEFYLEEIKNKRKYLLPKNGVLANFSNAKDILRIHFKETIHNNTIFVVFKITFLNGGTSMGFLDLKENILYTHWTFVQENKNIQLLNDNLSNFVLETYWYIICDNNIEYRKMSKMQVLTKENINNSYYLNQPLVKFNISSNTNKNKIKNYNNFNKNFDKTKYEIKQVNINYSFRKLPKNKSVSERAKKLAKEKNLIIPEGSTYVSPFIKNVNVKKDK